MAERVNGEEYHCEGRVDLMAFGERLFDVEDLGECRELELGTGKECSHLYCLQITWGSDKLPDWGHEDGSSASLSRIVRSRVYSSRTRWTNVT